MYIRFDFTNLNPAIMKKTTLFLAFALLCMAANAQTPNVIQYKTLDKIAKLEAETASELANLKAEIEQLKQAALLPAQSTLSDCPASNRIACYEIIDIGDWDMDTYPTKVVKHNINHKTILGVLVNILPDGINSSLPLGRIQGNGNTVEAGVLGHTSTTITLTRYNSGIFNSTTFDAINHNRGTVTIFYEL